MKPDSTFAKQDKDFWANVRLISQHVGYTVRLPRRKRAPDEPKESGPIKVPTLAEIHAALDELSLSSSHLINPRTAKPTREGKLLMAYYQHRANCLNDFVRPRLMDKDKAQRTFEQLRKRLCPNCPLPMNKQKGPKKAPAFFTGIINMLIESNAVGSPCDYDPRELTTFTRNRQPFRTLSRRVDGAFPGPVNPVAVWDIKEYYYTTTFGSRVADGVYESLLDGMELEELRGQGTDVKHYLMIDDYFTWWNCGRSYLCRIVDMLHMGYVDEALFGAEVVDRLPQLVAEWVRIAKSATQ
ncbi:MAG: hypothetical protein WD066_02160 [Planctomycetaceae bacterium]